MKHAIDIENLRHSYGKRVICQDLGFKVSRGKVFVLLGKNGMGKTTLIKILMGFLRPKGGICRILGDESHDLSPQARRKVGLLFEGHLVYEFMSIKGAECFFAPFFPEWRPELYHGLTDKLWLPKSHKIGKMSDGQRSQVVLGLIMAQQPGLKPGQIVGHSPEDRIYRLLESRPDTARLVFPEDGFRLADGGI